jgi:uncharacterized protein (DUF427 family)
MYEQIRVGRSRGSRPTARCKPTRERNTSKEAQMVKAIWNDTVIAETEETEIVEGNRYFPPESLSKEYFLESGTQTVCHWKGVARYFTVKVGDRENVDAAWYYPSPKAGASKISGKVAFWKGIKIVT